MLNWIRDAYHWATGSIGGTVIGWINGLITGVWHYLESIFAPVSAEWHEFANAWGTIEKFFQDFLNAVHVRFTDVIGWINKEGYEVYYYISHPDKLAGLVVEGVIATAESDAFAYGEKLGKFFAGLIKAHLKDFITMIEDILDAVL